MVSMVLKAVLALQLVASATARISYPARLEELSQDHRQLGGNCHDCSCFTCDSVEDIGDDLLKVTIGHCKNGDISWMCCVGLNGHEGNCALAGCSGNKVGAKCEGVSPQAGLQVVVPKGTETITVNTHDGKTAGNANMVNSVCGGNGNQGGSCKDPTAHCLIDFDLITDCGYTGEPAEEPEVPADCDEVAPAVCAMPDDAMKYSVVTFKDAFIGAHSMYKGLAIGGTLFDETPSEDATIDRTKSFINKMSEPARFNFNGGKSVGDACPAVSLEERFKYIAENAVSGDYSGGYKVVVQTNCNEEYDARSVIGAGQNDNVQGEDNGKTLVIFKCSGDIRLTKTSDGRQFGPTIIAPYAKVIVEDNCGFVDGSIFAKTVVAKAGSLQLHGDTYQGPIKCSVPDPEPEDEPEEPEPAGPPAPDEPTQEDKTTNNAFTKGDPHFKTFGGELYDYHGECDLVLLHNPDFKEGLGMDIHIRTKIEAFWSSVESAAIKIGDDTMEIKADPASNEWLWFNGKEMTSSVVDGEWNHLQLAGFLVRYKSSGPNTREANIYLKGSKGSKANEVLTMKTFKSFARIDVDWEGSENYINSVGLLGSHAHEGKRLGRDGKFIKNVNEFGQEWQVRPEVDGELFHSYEGAVVGKKCVMPPTYEKGDDLSVASLRGRRLGESALDTAAAEKACNHLVDPEEKKACVYDVIATQDLNMASTW